MAAHYSDRVGALQMLDDAIKLARPQGWTGHFTVGDPTDYRSPSVCFDQSLTTELRWVDANGNSKFAPINTPEGREVLRSPVFDGFDEALQAFLAREHFEL